MRAVSMQKPRFEKETDMRSILLLLLGVPLPIILLIGLFSHF
jgi:hypothetical protein